MAKKYVVIPGEVISQNDGDIHYIDAAILMQLYGVHPKDCYIVRSNSDATGLPSELTVLRPRYDGDYSLPEKENG